MPGRLASLLQRLSAACHAFGTLAILPAIAVLIVVDVWRRYLLDRPLAWATEVVGLLVFLLIMLCLPFASSQERHMRADVVYARLRGRWRTVADLATGLAGILLFALLGASSLRDGGYMLLARQRMETIGVPLWPFFAWMAMVCALLVIGLVASLRHARQPASAAPREMDAAARPPGRP